MFGRFVHRTQLVKLDVFWGSDLIRPEMDRSRLNEMEFHRKWKSLISSINVIDRC